MSKILMVQAPFGTGNDKRPPHIFDPHFPWGLGYISGVLKRENYDIELFDIYVHQWNKHEVQKRIDKLSYDYVLITAMATQYGYIKWLVNEFKKRNKESVIVLGGPLSTFSYKVVLRNTLVDICVIGPGEETIIEILSNEANLKAVSGIAFKSNDDVYVTETRKSKRVMDDLPRPAYELFNMDVYKTNKMYIYNKSMGLYSDEKRPPVMAMITGRGCPFSCNFCTPSMRNYSERSIESILEEIDFFIHEYGIGGINFVDELLFLKRDRINKMAEELGKRGVIWNGQSRIDTIDVDMLEYYKNNGLVSIGYGIESGSEFLLCEMNKKISVQRTEMVLKKTLEVGLHLKVYLIYGYPGENKDTLNETVGLFKRIGHPGRRFSILTPLPGSKIYELAKQRGLISNEDEYLSRIYEGFWRRVINMTEFTDEEFDRARIDAERRMVENYKTYMLSLSSNERQKHLLLCEQDFEKNFLEEIGR
jgi:radical SAM superfamily enzyme YgiQ (UPF0313 family)